jgi:hypothetical protein
MRCGQQAPVLIWDGEGLWPLRDWAQAITSQLVLFGRMERLAEEVRERRANGRLLQQWLDQQ